jgi:hypothetical protein
MAAPRRGGSWTQTGKEPMLVQERIIASVDLAAAASDGV